MLRFLLNRPISVVMSFIGVVALSIISYFKLPVSLLPSQDVPEITILIQHSNNSSEEINENIVKVLRESLLTLNGLRDIDALSQNETGKISIRFEYGTKMDLAYIEVNEKIDKLMPLLPQDMERPIVVKSNTSDIPVVRMQIVPKREEDILAVSELTTSVFKRRLEQLDGVGLIDVSGTLTSAIYITPDYLILHSLKLKDEDIIQAIESANPDLGTLSIKDGNYRYNLKLGSRFNNVKKIEEIGISLPENAGVVRLNQIAKVAIGPEQSLGLHLFGQQRAVVVAVHKQAEARLPELMLTLTEATNQFKKDYPELEFHLTQDQSQLLTLSIQNLSQSLMWGGLFAFAVLFFFMRGWREPLIMGIVLPLSLVLAFSIFYLFNISLNIISLSGLALGLGMLVDNSIVVIDSISFKRTEGFQISESCVLGTQEVIAPLIGSALTNVVVFAPLIFLSGLTGALFYDQAISVAAILFVSVLCTFILIPLLYLILFRKRKVSVQQDSKFYILIKNGYDRSFRFVWKYKLASLLLISSLMVLTIALLFLLPKQGFPKIKRTESIISIDWNDPIDINECRIRVSKLLADNAAKFLASESEIGYQQFTYNNANHSIQHAMIYLSFENTTAKERTEQAIKKYIDVKFPLATYQFSNAPNAFEQVFTSENPFLEARFRDIKSKKAITPTMADSLFDELKSIYPIRRGKGLETETSVLVLVDFNKINTYQVEYQSIVEKLKTTFGERTITSLKNFGDVIPIVFSHYNGDFETAIRTLTIKAKTGTEYSIREFITTKFDNSFKSIATDASGIYQSFTIDDANDISKTKDAIAAIAKKYSLTVDFAGRWLDDEENFSMLTFLMVISILLMYFILTAEFESLVYPALVMITIPIGFSGSLLLLWATGGSLDIMSGIGLVVVLGILDNDAILKIDRINYLRKTLPLDAAIKQAGTDRLKPIVMNTCTNILAITPIVFSSGLGADLQRPIAITTIGGLIVGTFTALYFIPLLYWFVFKND